MNQFAQRLYAINYGLENSDFGVPTMRKLSELRMSATA